MDSPGASDANFDEIELEHVFDSDEHNEDFLMTGLKYWATSYSVSSLLSILKVFHPSLPIDGRNLLGTQKKCLLLTFKEENTTILV